MTSSLPQFLRDLLASCPTAGTGVHTWLYRVARQLHTHYPDKAEMARLLEAACHGCGRHVKQSEIQDAIANSEQTAWQPGSDSDVTSRPAAKWPSVNQGLRAAITRDGGGLADLWELSRPRLEDTAQHTEEIVDRLFPDNPLLCCGRYAKKPDGESYTAFDTMPRESWRGELALLELIVPSPMSAPLGRKKNPKPGESQWSAHTLDNTDARRFLICEFDAGTTDEHAALLLNLGTFAPLVCAVHSAGKSLHGWFYGHGQPEERILRFFRYAVSLGADPATWTRSQFVRMPDGTRNNGKRQPVFFLNLKPLETTR